MSPPPDPNPNPPSSGRIKDRTRGTAEIEPIQTLSSTFFGSSKHFKIGQFNRNTKNYGQITLNIKPYVDPLSSTSKSTLWGSYFDFHYTCLLCRDWRHVSSIILKWPKSPLHVSFTELALFSAYKIHNIKVIRGTEPSLRNVEVSLL